MKNGVNKNFLDVRLKPMKEIHQIGLLPLETLNGNYDAFFSAPEFNHIKILIPRGEFTFLNTDNQIWDRRFKQATTFKNGTAVVQDTDGIYHLATPTRYLFFSGTKEEIEDKKKKYADPCYEQPTVFVKYFFEKYDIAASKELRNLCIEMVKIALLTKNVSIKDGSKLLDSIKSIIQRRSQKPPLEQVIEGYTNLQNTDAEESLKPLD